ncbi:hypothetical protein LY78DRAFT_288463 [Colletotrichum sublineola]|nr:hypothetical protein LY78DRAFT_288463 [Colletotrichum sublineola]
MNGRSRTSPVHPATTLARSATSKMTWVKLPNVAALACSMPPPLVYAVHTRKFRIALRLWLCLLFLLTGCIGQVGPVDNTCVTSPFLSSLGWSQIVSFPPPGHALFCFGIRNCALLSPDPDAPAYAPGPEFSYASA